MRQKRTTQTSILEPNPVANASNCAAEGSVFKRTLTAFITCTTLCKNTP